MSQCNITTIQMSILAICDSEQRDQISAAKSQWRIMELVEAIN